MKNELQSDFYDNAYLISDKYKDHYSKSIYYPIWQSIIPNITGVLADFGCGTGQFAEMCIDSGVHYGFGVDFSPVAIEKCKRLKKDFYCESLYDFVLNSFHVYDTVVMLEVLEHLKLDLAVLNQIAPSTRVILSVPNFDSISHVRHFQDETEVRERYEQLLEVDRIETFSVGNKGNKIFVLYGYKP